MGVTGAAVPAAASQFGSVVRSNIAVGMFSA